jgi:monoamine oxidase
MKIIESDIIIIGAGLTGLTIAYLLRHQNLSVHIIEARGRIGGRIHTKYNENLAPQEMGATWLGKKHSDLIALLQELNVGIFKQELSNSAIYEPISTSPPQLVTLPPNDDPSYRIQGGTTSLINALADKIELSQIFLNQIVETVLIENETVSIKSATHDFQTKKIISTLPPNLFLNTIAINANLPTELINIGKNTHTWMGESIKVSLTYLKPFWQENSSGTIVSNVGPVSEMYDHSNYEDDRFGLIGFLNGAYFSITKSERLELVMKQLEKYYGSAARSFVSYEETVWRKEPFTFTDYESHILPHQNNGHPVFRQPFLDKKLIIAGSETATQFPGYMEGAVRSAKAVCTWILG